MNLRRLGFTALLAALPALTACETSTVLGFAIGDISGLWLATTYVYAENAAGQGAVDLVERDGARFTLVVDNSTNPPIASTTFNDGMGNEVSGGGPVDIVVGTLEIEGAVFTVDHDGNEMTIVNGSAMFDFGSGSRNAVLTIELERP